VRRRQLNETKLSILRHISSAVGREFDVGPILEATVTSIGEALGASRCFIYQLDYEGVLPVTHEFTQPAVTPIEVGTTLVMPATYLAHQTGKTVAVDDLSSDSRFEEAIDRHVYEQLGVFSSLAVPITFQGTQLGIIGLHQCDRQRAWSADEIDLVETVASHIAVLIQSCRVCAEQEKLTRALSSMNEDLSRLYVELSAKDEQIARFMHLISHDLRSPIVAIQGLVDLLKRYYQDEPPDSRPRRYLELVKNSSEQITNLIGALLQYARLGQSSLHLEVVETEQLVQETWQRLAIVAPDGELAVFSSLPTVSADRSKLAQVFQNLLENAIKYRKPDSRLLVDITCQDVGEHWQFAVNDNGIGFHPSEAENLFDLFIRLKEVRTRPGSGIGLASVLEIARLHGGTAWAVGRPGSGSTFYFTIAKHVRPKPDLSELAVPAPPAADRAGT